MLRLYDVLFISHRGAQRARRHITLTSLYSMTPLQGSWHEVGA